MDYCRIAADPSVLDNRVRKVLEVPKVVPELPGQADLFGDVVA